MFQPQLRTKPCSQYALPATRPQEHAQTPGADERAARRPALSIGRLGVDELLGLERAEQFRDLPPQVCRFNVELLEHLPLDPNPVVPGFEQLPEPRPRLVERIDAVRAQVDQDDFVVQAPRNDVRARPKTWRRSAGGALRLWSH